MISYGFHLLDFVWIWGGFGLISGGFGLASAGFGLDFALSLAFTMIFVYSSLS